jgi:hypothetical protein
MHIAVRPALNYIKVLHDAFAAPVLRERMIGACRVYVVLTYSAHAHAPGVAKAAAAIGKRFERHAHYDLSNALCIGYDNFEGTVLGRGTTVERTLRAAGIDCYRVVEGD